jgi:hypothetical protein
MSAAPQSQGESGYFPKVPEVIFPNWRELLNQSGLPGNTAGGYAIAISGYLDYCRKNAVSVSQPSARAFMEDAARRGLAEPNELRTFNIERPTSNGGGETSSIQH